MISGCGLEVGSGGIGPSRKRRSLARMSQLGHEERFPPTRLSAGCGFRKETIAGMRRNGRDAPKNEPARAGGSACRGRRVFGEVMCGSA
jgi:hypothetical protein